MFERLGDVASTGLQEMECNDGGLHTVSLQVVGRISSNMDGNLLPVRVALTADRHRGNLRRLLELFYLFRELVQAII